ncbi:molybdopterin-containing oxidoreductase family protein [Mariprofundus ferrooxydans]|uniref:molybdopterin-containing oxidoreductase family protein n=1 Tax=Mariprofundus ferrooxydans TaxID=314344 RepID=UPI001430ADD4|nr:molybdopterin-dependent oxidoreductase [Mariprofundus ferrooxydans]
MSENKSSSNWTRRSFIKAMGLGGAAGSALVLSGCGDTDIINEVDIEVRKEKVEPNVDPQDYVRPGIEMYYASTCRQCPAGCGVHARIREGRVLKLEGNPVSDVNHGRLCPMGQAGLQSHYNPDRLTKPMLRKGGKLVEISWDEAEDVLRKNLGRKNAKLAWLSGATSGHHRALVDAYLAAAGAKNHFVFDTLPPAVGHAANQEMFGSYMPRLDFDKARLIVSFGADFLGTWMSPVQFSTQYAEFRNAPRGTLVQIEPKMTLTGANADRWIPARPGTEGHLALALASLLVQKSEYADRVPADVVASLKDVNVDEVAKLCDIPVERIHHLHHLMTDRSPSLVLSGASAEGVQHGSETARAILMLNVLLGNVGETILPRSEDPFPALAPRMGGWSEVKAMVDGLNKGSFDTVVVFGSNPLYQAPGFMQADKAFDKAKFRISFSMFPDETTMACDLVLPVHSYLEEWNTTMPAYAATDGYLGLQQPVMNPVFGSHATRSFGDLMLDVLKHMDPNFKQWDSYQAYVMGALWTMRPALVKQYKPSVPGQTEEEAFKQGILSDGFVQMKVAKAAKIEAKVSAVTLPAEKANANYPFRLIPSARLGLWDGRHANVPWLQELPDQLTEVVWDSWIEIHPKTAEKLGVITGDVVQVESSAGKAKVKVVVFPGIHPDAVAIPLGQGHTEYGRYAKGVGVNPFSILAALFDGKTGELATYATDVKVAKIESRGKLVTLANGDLVLESNTSTQAGRELVKTTTAENFDLTEKGA